jgi:hypothetical protein
MYACFQFSVGGQRRTIVISRNSQTQRDIIPDGIKQRVSWEVGKETQ